MELHYRISLWNYGHYTYPQSLEAAIAESAANGYGVELWDGWKEDRKLFSPLYRERLRVALANVPSSLHSGGVQSLADHQVQIDCAAHIGSDVIVIHPGHLNPPDGKGPDLAYGRDVVQYAAARGVTIALENGPLWFLAAAIEGIEGLKICIDTGHLYFEEGRRGQGPASMAEYLRVLRPRLAHLHLQDRLDDSDHYILGTGRIPPADWELLVRALEEDDFRGAGVFEIQPRRVLRTAAESVAFLQRFGLAPQTRPE